MKKPPAVNKISKLLTETSVGKLVMMLANDPNMVISVDLIKTIKGEPGSAEAWLEIKAFMNARLGVQEPK